MNFYARGFNLYLLAALLLCGCATKDKDKNAFLGTLRVHIESSGTIPDGKKSGLASSGLPDVATHSTWSCCRIS